MMSVTTRGSRYTLCWSMSLYLKGPFTVAPSAARHIHMAVGMDSVRYKEYFKELYDEMGIKMLTEATSYYQQH